MLECKPSHNALCEKMKFVSFADLLHQELTFFMYHQLLITLFTCIWFSTVVPLPEIISPLKNATVQFQQTVTVYCLASSHGVLEEIGRKCTFFSF